jgi:hypothetical protein
MPFKIINAINAGKEPDDISAFNPWLTNRFFSFFPDTLFFAQYMNMNYDLEPRYQLDFFINTIRPSKRWQKWLKKEQSADYDLIRDYYAFSDKKTKEALAVLTKEQIGMIREKAPKE